MVVAAGVLSCVFTMPVLAAETEPTGLKNVVLSIFPEYDRTTLLIMVQGEIEGAAPASVRFLVPEGAVMYSAGWMDTWGNYQRGMWEGDGPPPAEPSDVDSWDEVAFGIDGAMFRVEYYYDVIEGYPDKTLSAEFISLYPVANLTVYVQEPLESSSFGVTPESPNVYEDDGFVLHNYTYDMLNAKEKLSFDVSYTKSDADPSLTILDRPSPTNWLLVIGLAISGAIILGIGVYWVLRGLPERHRVGKESKKPIRRQQKKIQNSSGKSLGPPRFCTKCGSKLDDSVKYCSNCGAQI